MEYYQNAGEPAKAEVHRNAVLAKNPNSNEIRFRVKYFDVENSMAAIDSASSTVMADSSALAQINKLGKGSRLGFSPSDEYL